ETRVSPRGAEPAGRIRRPAGEGSDRRRTSTRTGRRPNQRVYRDPGAMTTGSVLPGKVKSGRPGRPVTSLTLVTPSIHSVTRSRSAHSISASAGGRFAWMLNRWTPTAVQAARQAPLTDWVIGVSSVWV